MSGPLAVYIVGGVGEYHLPQEQIAVFFTMREAQEFVGWLVDASKVGDTYHIQAFDVYPRRLVYA